MDSQLSGSPLSVCSFNMGSSASDYMQLCQKKQLNLQFKSREEEAVFLKKYADVQKVSSEILIQKNCDVYCLQEAGEETRALIELLKKKNYRIIHIENEIFDAAIAINQERFSDIVNLSHQITLTKIFKKDVAMASATDKKTGTEVIIVSGHVPGFTFADPQEEVIAEGDNYCKAISERLAQLAEPALYIIGADMNGSPENAGDRFQVFVEAGFHVCRTDSPTNLNMKDADQPERELDFILVKEKSSMFSRVAAFFQMKKKASFKVDVEPKSVLSWDPEQNSSDHLPICATISKEKE